ncbi:2-methylaconitate cis-trans isomerase PrpF [Vibrio metschnikovii]
MSNVHSIVSSTSDSTVGSVRQIKIPATYLRGGTSNGVFFKLSDLPLDAQLSGEYRDRLLLRVMGSPDAYGKQIDGMGGGSSSTSKVALISKSQQADHDIDYLFGQVAIDQPQIDWSGNCGNLSAAVGPFAIEAGLIDPARIPEQGVVEVKVWQTNIQKTLIIHVPIVNGQVQEIGDFQLDGVAFPAPEIQVEFIEPAEGQGAIFPTGNLRDCLSIPGLGDIEVTLINAGIATIFLDAHRLGYQGDEGQEAVNTDLEMLAKLEMIRAHGALKMGLIEHLEQAKARQHTPKIAFVAPSKAYLHRTNLVGMGVLPLQFMTGMNRLTLDLDGSELFDVRGVIQPNARLTLTITRRDQSSFSVSVICRLETEDELDVYQAGGVLPRFAEQFLTKEKPL